MHWRPSLSMSLSQYNLTSETNLVQLRACKRFVPSNHICKRFPDLFFLTHTGTLLTFAQFSFVAAVGYVSQFDSSRPPLFISANKVPLRRWVINIILFFAINVLNNHAFSYDISVPVHIILRSGGSITTMAAGLLCGRRYSRVQMIAVLLLSVGVSLAALSDAKAKVTQPIVHIYITI